MRATDTNFQPDVPYRIRQTISPWITRIARALGQPEYRLRHTEYVGTVHLPMDELERELRAGGFAWGPISWYHQPPVGTEPDGSWTYRPSALADRQLHVVLSVQAPECIDVFAHEEYNWLRHPLQHGRQVGIHRAEGSAEMRDWLERRGVDVEYESRTRRRATRLARRVRSGLSARFGFGW